MSSPGATVRRGRGGSMMVTVNVVVLAGTVAADPVERRMPSGDEVADYRLRDSAQADLLYGQRDRRHSSSSPLTGHACEWNQQRARLVRVA